MLVSSTDNAILVCPVQRNQAIAKTAEVTIARSLPACFNLASSRDFGLIIVNVPDDREAAPNRVLDLCRGLKSHSETRETPVIVSLEFIDRELIVKWVNTGIRFMDLREKGAPIDPARLLYLTRRADPSIRIDLILARLCPFLDHRRENDGYMLTTCRAYRNRMVLGGKRLHEVCESDCHVYCEYYLHPRFTS